jgi:predicted small lipoprotein YifL
VAYTVAVAQQGTVMQLKLPVLIACSASACLLLGCGQTGALYLPDAGVTTPVEIRPAPATPEAADQPPEAEKQDNTEGEGTPPAQE